MVIKLCFANNLNELNASLKQLDNINSRLQFLQDNQQKYTTADTATRHEYWLLLGTLLEENKQFDAALQVFAQSLTELSGIKDNFAEIYVKILLESSYVKYLQTHDPQVYCPQRKLAYQSLVPQISVETQVRIHVQYAFCFQFDRNNFSEGLSLLDQALAMAKKHQLSANTHALIYNAAGLIYGKNQLFDKSYQYLLNAYQQWQQVNDYQDMFNMLHSLTEVSIERLDFDLAQHHIDQMFALATSQRQFTDFTFFALYKSGFLASAQGKLAQSNNYFSKALAEQNNTSETYFVKNVYEALIANYFQLGDVAQAKYYLSALSNQYPEHQIMSREVNAFKYFVANDHLAANQQLMQQIDHEVSERRLLTGTAAQTTSKINSQNIAELDNKILQQTVEIQELKLQKQQTEKDFVYLLLGIGIFTFVGLSLFSYYLFRSRKVFQHHARIDYLTGIYNRRFLFEKSHQALNRCANSASDISLLLIDIDNFKHINDTYGHLAGDQSLQFVVAECNKLLPEQGFIGRLGGDEFLIMLPNYRLELAKDLAERIRVAVNTGGNQMIKSLGLTLSIGVLDCTKAEDLAALIVDADTLLYQAKSKGRNTVVDQSLDLSN